MTDAPALVDAAEQPSPHAASDAVDTPPAAPPVDPPAPPAALLAALMAAQASLDGVAKSGRNAQQGWSFVTVEDITRACRQALTANGLTAVYRLRAGATADAGIIDAELLVAHPASGEQLALPMPWPVERAGPQARRAAFSYGRKQSLVELLMVAEPDDPETHAETAAQPPAARADTGRGPSPMTDAQRRMLWAVARRVGYGDTSELAAYAAGQLGLDADSAHPDELLRSLTRQEASHLIDTLQTVQPAARVPADRTDPVDDEWTTEPQAGES